MPELADCLAGFIAALDLDRAHVVGLSLGAALAIQLCVPVASNAVARQRTTQLVITRVAADGSTKRRPDRLIVEEPMTIQLDGEVVTTTMRTPGNDFELAAGFCLTEGLLAGMPVTGVRYCGNGASAAASEFNAVTVETGKLAPVPVPRLGTTSSSCGLCGRDQLDALTARLDPFPADDQPPIALDVQIGRAHV